MPLRLTGTHMIANYNHTSRDTNADLKWRQHLKIANSFDQSQTCTHGSLDIIFMSCWIAEINKNSITHVVGDETVPRFHCFSDTAVIGADHLPKVFEIETS
jgi:hypothetical protein